MENETSSKKKPFYKKWWVWVLAVFVFFIIIGSLGNGNNTANNSSTDKTATETSTQNTPAQPKTWQKVIELTTNANKQSETFHLDGGQQKVVYTTTGGGATLCSIYVMDEGTSLDEIGGFPIVTIDGTSSDETMMRKKQGDYYLDVKAVNGTCSLEIQELK